MKKTASLLITYCFLPMASATKLLVHYMPWYESKQFSGEWGLHWTDGNRFNPDTFNKDGLRNIYSHYHPLSDCYDSCDPDALEMQVLLMKFAGIDGVIADWFGTSDFRLFPFIHRSTMMLFELAQRAGLNFAIVYADRTIKWLVEHRGLTEQQALQQARADIAYAERNWFDNDAYVKVDGRPILPVFGPIHFVAKGPWQQILDPLKPRPLFYALPHRCEPTGSDGAFGWVPVSGGRTISAYEQQRYLNNLYQLGKHETESIGVAYPQFHDIYQTSYGHISPRDGQTFSETLAYGLDRNASIIQIATWNDYGEGTQIEPTVEQGYQYLEQIQNVKEKRLTPGFGYNAEDLRLPLEFYRLRKIAGLRKIDVQALLHEASGLLFQGKVKQARSVIHDISQQLGETENTGTRPDPPDVDGGGSNDSESCTLAQEGDPCRKSNQCCSGRCKKKRCQAPSDGGGSKGGDCTATGDRCKKDDQCCSGSCKGKLCQINVPPPPSPDVDNGGSEDSDCPLLQEGDRCKQHEQCCSGSCQGKICQGQGPPASATWPSCEAKCQKPPKNGKKCKRFLPGNPNGTRFLPCKAKTDCCPLEGSKCILIKTKLGKKGYCGWV